MRDKLTRSNTPTHDVTVHCLPRTLPQSQGEYSHFTDGAAEANDYQGCHSYQVAQYKLWVPAERCLPGARGSPGHGTCSDSFTHSQKCTKHKLALSY